MEDCPTRNGKTPWLAAAGYALLVLYTLEAAARLFCERLEAFKQGWNNLDFSIVLSGWASEIFTSFPSVRFLRFLRTLRLLRMFRVFVAIRELYLLVSGMMSALRTLFFSSIMLFGLLTIWSIVLVENVHPVNVLLEYEACERCPRAFRSVMTANLTLFQQIVTGDSWGNY